jgi:hypothetical protein
MAVVLNGRYELGEIVGSGGMGSVHRAIDTRLGRTVAVKMLREEPGTDETARLRMRREARLAAGIHHPGVAQVYDVGDNRTTGQDQTFLVMQLVEGHTLAQLLREKGPMSTDQVMSIVVQVADGLQAAHDAGVVHRDLKPANIMLTPAGRTVLVDFGIARAASSEPLTSTGALLGTVEYMSPEQVRGRQATPQSDLYALGVVAIQCLTGTSPFRRDSSIATAMAQLHEEIPPLAPEVPREITRLLTSMTAKDPSDRPGSAAVVARRAAEVGAAGSIELPATFQMAAVGGEQTTPPPPPRRRRPIAILAAAGMLVAATAVLGAQQLRSDEPQSVPGVVGMDVADASSEIRGAGMTAVRTSVDAAGTPEGQVVEQSPAAGRPEATDGRVTVSVASGRVLLPTDELIGQTYAAASAALAELGLEVRRADVTQAANAGRVVALDRAGRVRDGSRITLSVAVAPASTAPTTPSAPTGSGSSSGAGTSTGGSTAKGNGAGNGKGAAKNKNKGKANGKG